MLEAEERLRQLKEKGTRFEEALVERERHQQEEEKKLDRLQFIKEEERKLVEDLRQREEKEIYFDARIERLQQEERNVLSYIENRQREFEELMSTIVKTELNQDRKPQVGTIRDRGEARQQIQIEPERNITRNFRQETDIERYRNREKEIKQQVNVETERNRIQDIRDNREYAPERNRVQDTRNIREYITVRNSIQDKRKHREYVPVRSRHSGSIGSDAESSRREELDKREGDSISALFLVVPMTDYNKTVNTPNLSASPRIVTFSNPGKAARVPVRVCNMSAKMVTLPPKTSLCDLHEVKVLCSLPLGVKDSVKAHVSQQRVETEKPSHLDRVDLSDTKLSTEQKHEVLQFLQKWQHVFSKSSTDLGCTDLVQHEIHLKNEQPFKEPYRSIPPALIQEVREHLKAMLEVGAVRCSNSPFSSNVVIVRKKDGTIRFCIDYRKMNLHTIKDAYAIPRIYDTQHLLAGAKYFTKLDLKSGYWQVEL